MNFGVFTGESLWRSQRVFHRHILPDRYDKERNTRDRGALQKGCPGLVIKNDGVSEQLALGNDLNSQSNDHVMEKFDGNVS